MMPRKAPAQVRPALRQVLAIVRLAQAAQAVLEAETQTATLSYAENGQSLTDAQWRRADARGFALYRELKSALREMARAQGGAPP
jgi:hypothetical protein